MESLGLKCKMQHKLKTKNTIFWGPRLRLNTPNTRCNINQKWRRALIFENAT
jgi:hypothetical protein